MGKRKVCNLKHARFAHTKMEEVFIGEKVKERGSVGWRGLIGA